MTAQQRRLLEFSSPPAGTVILNDRVSIRTEGSHRAVFLQGLLLMHYDVKDHAAEECAMVTLFEAGYADQNDIARAFGCTPRTSDDTKNELSAAGSWLWVDLADVPRRKVLDELRGGIGRSSTSKNEASAIVQLP